MAERLPTLNWSALTRADDRWRDCAQTGTTTEWSYTGEQNDPTGLEYLRARYYDASTGRFLSQDPLPLLQRYAYATGEPGGSERHAAKR